MKEHTLARWTGAAFLLIGIVNAIGSIIGMYLLNQVGAALSAFGALAGSVSSASGASSISSMISFGWVIMTIELLGGIAAIVAGAGWLRKR